MVTEAFCGSPAAGEDGAQVAGEGGHCGGGPQHNDTGGDCGGVPEVRLRMLYFPSVMPLPVWEVQVAGSHDQDKPGSDCMTWQCSLPVLSDDPIGAGLQPSAPQML